MRAAAKLHRNAAVFAHFDHAHNLAVFLAEHCDSALLLCLLDRKLLGHDRMTGEDPVVDGDLDLKQLVRCHRLKMGEVEAQAIRLDQRARLMDVVTQYPLECGVQKMRGTVGAADRVAACGVDHRKHRVAHGKRTVFQSALVQVLSALVLLHVCDLELRVFLPIAAYIDTERTGVGDLTAHLCIERGAIQHHDGLIARFDLVAQLAVHHDGKHLRLRQMILVARKYGSGDLLAEIDARPAEIAQRLARLACTLLLLLHQRVERVLVHT